MYLNHKRWPTIVWARFVVETCGWHQNRSKNLPWSRGVLSEGGGSGVVVAVMKEMTLRLAFERGRNKGVVVDAPLSILYLKT